VVNTSYLALRCIQSVSRCSQIRAGSVAFFGCACYPCLIPYNKKKLEYRSIKCIFLGYSLNHKGSRCIDPSTGRVYISRHVVFDERAFPFSNNSYNTQTHDTSATSISMHGPLSAWLPNKSPLLCPIPTYFYSPPSSSFLIVCANVSYFQCGAKSHTLIVIAISPDHVLDLKKLLLVPDVNSLPLLVKIRYVSVKARA
jgi:hypothetical protein